MNSQLTGAAGVFYVASELSMRGLVVLPSIRNVKGADILVADPDGKCFAFLQVKTSQYKVTFWPIGESALKWKGRDCYYVFVRRVHGRFEAFLEKASVVAKEVAAADRMATERGNKKWALAWPISGRDATPGSEERTRRQWEEFTLAPEHTYGKDPCPPKE
ncbi:MAG: hypothetical protein ABSG73_11070 [Candidatus Aminicenantales bacterium]|jgi:hypothetical protein